MTYILITLKNNQTLYKPHVRNSWITSFWFRIYFLGLLVLKKWVYFQMREHLICNSAQIVSKNLLFPRWQVPIGPMFNYGAWIYAQTIGSLAPTLQLAASTCCISPPECRSAMATILQVCLSWEWPGEAELQLLSLPDPWKPLHKHHQPITHWWMLSYLLRFLNYLTKTEMGEPCCFINLKQGI